MILYEVYSKRAIHEPIDALVILDRDTSRKKAIASARKWGAVVLQIEARILERYPLAREVISTKVIFIHRARRRAADQRPMNRKELMGKLRQNSKSLYKGFRR